VWEGTEEVPPRRPTRPRHPAPPPPPSFLTSAHKISVVPSTSNTPVTIEIRWCPAHQGITGNEKADEWAKIAAEKPSTRGVENPGPLPRSLVSLKREISEKKWAEARSWAGGRISKAKYRMAKSQKPDSEVANSTKRLASRFYQLKTGHARIGQYLHWAKVRPDAQCWWCKCPSQTRDHLFKVCPEWKVQQKVLWAEVQKEKGRWKSRWKIRDLLADKRCGKAVLDFLTATDVGRLVPPVEEDGAGSQTSEWELRERQEREEE